MSDGQVRIVIEGESDDLGRALKAAARDLDRFDAQNRKTQRSVAKEVGATDKAFSGLTGSMRNVNVNATFMRNTLSLLKWPTLIAGAGTAAQALDKVAAGGGAVVGSLGQMAPLVGALPGLYSEAGQAAGVAALAFKGVGEALGGDAAAMAKLTPQGQALVKTLQEMQPAVKGLQKSAQSGLFPGVEKGIKDASKNLPVLDRAVRRTSGVLGELAARAGGKLGSRDWGTDLASITKRNAKNLGIAGDAALHLAEALKDVMVSAGPLTTALSKDVDTLAKRLEHLAAEGRASGDMGRAFKAAHDELKLTLDIAKNLGATLVNVFRAGAPTGTTLLTELDDASKTWREWTASMHGQNELQKWFADSRPDIELAAKLIADLAKAVVRLGQGDEFEQLLRKLDELVPGLESMVQSTTAAFGPAVLDAAGEFAKLMTNLAGSSGPLVLLVKALTQALKLLNELIDTAPGLKAALVTGLGAASVFKALQIAEAITGMRTLRKLVTGIPARQAATTAAESAAGGAAGGGLGGKLLSKLPAGAGPVGLAVGAGLLAAQAVGPAPSPAAHLVGKLPTDATKAAAAIDGLNRKLAALQAAMDRTSDARAHEMFERQAADLKKMRAELEKTAAPVDGFRSAISRLAKVSDGDLSSIRANVRITTTGIKKQFGDTSEAKDLLAENFRAAATAVKNSMDAGALSTKTGIALMNKYLREALAQYGITGKEASRYISGADTKTGKSDSSVNTGKVGAATGYIGREGAAGHDTVPLLVGEGEAVVNRHQQSVINRALEAVGIRGLPELFSKERRPHYAAMAKGGFAAMIQKANAIDARHYPYRWGGGHDAAFSGPYDCSGAWSAVLHAGGMLGAPRVSGDFMNFGLPGPGPVTLYANAGHVYGSLGGRFWGTSGDNPGGGAGWFDGGPRAGFAVRHVPVLMGDGKVKMVPWTGPGGAVGALGQAGLDRLHSGAQSVVDRVGDSLMGGTTGGGDPQEFALGGIVGRAAKGKHSTLVPGNKITHKSKVKNPKPLKPSEWYDAINADAANHAEIVAQLANEVRPTADTSGTDTTADQLAAAQALNALLRSALDTSNTQHAIDASQFGVFSGFAPLLAGRMLGSYDRGIMDVPADMLAVLHKGETVTPNPNGPYGTALAPPAQAAQAPQITLVLKDRAGDLVELVDARIDGRAARLTSESLGRRQRLLTIAAGGS